MREYSLCSFGGHKVIYNKQVNNSNNENVNNSQLDIYILIFGIWEKRSKANEKSAGAWEAKNEQA